MRRLSRAVNCGLVGLWACAAGCAQPAARSIPDDAQPELAIAELFMHDAGFRRATLERSLLVPDNGYALRRLEHYARAGGWDDLPEHDPPVRRSDEPEPAAVWDGGVPRTRSAWLELGRRAFERYPAQRIPGLRALLDQPELAARIGLQAQSVVLATYADGSEQTAVTCATCHARTGSAGALTHGPASDLDLGAVIEHPGTNGLVDVTADGLDNPVAMPDLLATRSQRSLHATGNVQSDLSALAVRVETLLITSNAEAVRPPRAVAFALAVYVWSLGDASAQDALPLEGEARAGERVFDAVCRECHEGEHGQGDAIAAALVGVDDAVARSSERGDPDRPRYRVPSLFRVAERTRLMHDGRIRDLDALLSPERDFEGATHRFGLELDDADRAALRAYLAQL